jgi:hypothetical protein
MAMTATTGGRSRGCDGDQKRMKQGHDGDQRLSSDLRRFGHDNDRRGGELL